MGRGLQLLRKKADLLGTRNAFNDLRGQHGLGNRFFNKTQVSKLLRVMENLEAVEKWRATLTEKDRIRWASPDASETEIAAAATPTSIRLMWRHDFASPWDDQGHQNCRAKIG
jgi:hypothetical protein